MGRKQLEENLNRVVIQRDRTSGKIVISVNDGRDDLETLKHEADTANLDYLCHFVIDWSDRHLPIKALLDAVIALDDSFKLLQWLNGFLANLANEVESLAMERVNEAVRRIEAGSIKKST